MVLLVALAFYLVSSTFAANEPTCATGESTCNLGNQKVTSAGQYYWPMAMGHPNYYSNPPWPGPTDLASSFSWKFLGPTGTRFEDSFVGAAIDDKKNIYANGDYTVYKLSETGALIWSYKMPSQTGANGPALYDGNLYGSTRDGRIFAVDMESGVEQWVTQASEYRGWQYSQLAAHQGILVTDGGYRCQTMPWDDCGQARVAGLNASDGRILWMYDPEEVLWDWFPQFPDDESVVFMDKTGGLFRLHLQSGVLMWKVAGAPNTWTGGSQFVASNGLTYAVQANQFACREEKKGHLTECSGYITAYKTSDGSRVWQKTVLKGPNTSPVVGRLGGSDKLSLVMGLGFPGTDSCDAPAGSVYQAFEGWPEWIRVSIFYSMHKLSLWLGDNNGWLWGTDTRTHDLYAFDAETGKLSWIWSGPTIHRKCNRGDEDGMVPRMNNGLRIMCCSMPWSQPRIGTDGTIYTGYENGYFFAIRDANGNNKIETEEVSVYDTGATFPHTGSAHAPGMVVAVNMDGVFVWKS